jgi:hypothetical protein
MWVKTPLAGQLAGGRERAEYGLQDRRLVVQRLCGQPQGRNLPAQVTPGYVQLGQARPLFCLGHSEPGYGPYAPVIWFVAGLSAPILNAIGPGRHKLHQVEIVGLLPPDRDGSQPLWRFIIDGPVPPQADGDAVRFRSLQGRPDPFPMRHLFAGHSRFLSWLLVSQPRRQFE